MSVKLQVTWLIMLVWLSGAPTINFTRAVSMSRIGDRETEEKRRKRRRKKTKWERRKLRNKQKKTKRGRRIGADYSVGAERSRALSKMAAGVALPAAVSGGLNIFEG